MNPMLHTQSIISNKKGGCLCSVDGELLEREDCTKCVLGMFLSREPTKNIVLVHNFISTHVMCLKKSRQIVRR